MKILKINKKQMDDLLLDKIFFDNLSDKLKMIRLKKGTNKDKQIDDLINFVC